MNESTDRRRAQGIRQVGIAIIVCQLLLCGGCIALMPGDQSAAALKQYSRVQWNKDDEIDVVNRGPQTAAWIMASGGVIVFATDEDGNALLDENGNPVLDLAKSKPDYFFSSKPSAEHAAQIAPIFATESTKQVEALVPAMTKMISELIEAYKEIARLSVENPSDETP